MQIRSPLFILFIACTILAGVVIPGAASRDIFTEWCPYPDMTPENLQYQSPFTAAHEFSFTFTTYNRGNAASGTTPIQVVLPDYTIIDIPDMVPPLQPGESIEMTETFIIPAISYGRGMFQVILDPDNTMTECIKTNNDIQGFLRILSICCSPEEYEQQTKVVTVKNSASSSPGSGSSGPIGIPIWILK